MGHNDIVIELLKRGAQIDEQDNNKRTALIYASKNGHRGS
ncbi:ankyrin repeat domain-containing protein [Desulfotomaculum nigrificans]